ncbi:hypothetical protein CASFOL_006789 [Castilleja foliolosa]|uniref:F-box domain-containing protein n=1 Tax=Castilleja foliolosa TaxID=1961234 RepID=A0ABD3E8C0_9LAMI
MEKSSQEIVASIDDLLTEILLRLPVKSLIRFKQVSKHWQSLISDPGFGFRHKPIPSPAVGMFVHRCFVTTISRYISFSNEKPTNKLVEKLNGVDIIQSCNGLLLCSSSLTKPKYFVYNATTNKSSTFPYGGGTKEWGVKGMSLAFDPARSCHFKIVRVRERYMVEYEYRFEVYSSENGCWRKPDGLFRSRFNFKNGVYWNGAIHWINHKMNNMTRECLYFNPDDDDPMVMPRMAPSISVPGVGK